jgi:hypothetical protein
MSNINRIYALKKAGSAARVAAWFGWRKYLPIENALDILGAALNKKSRYNFMAEGVRLAKDSGRAERSKPGQIVSLP